MNQQTTRRVPQPRFNLEPDLFTAGDVIDHHQSSHPSRTTRKINWSVVQAFGYGFFALLALIILLSFFLGALRTLQYGAQPMTQTDATVGLADSPATPTHFIAQNLNGQIYVVVIPGGDPSKTMVIVGPRPFGKDATKMVPQIEVVDANHDGKPDIRLDVDSTLVVYYNDGKTFNAVEAPAKAPAEVGAPMIADTSTMEGPSGLSAEQIDTILKNYNSPAVGTGKDFITFAKAYNIRAEWALATFIHESSAGTKGIATRTLSIGNIRCSSGYSCISGFRSYDSWASSIKDYYQLVRNLYINSWHLTTIDSIIAKYAPSSENDTSGYVKHLKSLVSKWSAGDFS